MRCAEILNVFKEKGLSKDENEVLNHARKLFNWRKDKEVIHYGKMTHYWPDKNLYVFFRYLKDDIVMVLINNNNVNQNINWLKYSESIKEKREGKDIITGERFVVGNTSIIKAQTSMIIEFD